MGNKVGARPSETGSSEPNPAVSALSGFDPARIRELMAAEHITLEALNYAYHSGKMEYLHFSAGYDATVARAAALSWLESAIATEAGTAETVEQGSVHEGAGLQASPTPPLDPTPKGPTNE